MEDATMLLGVLFGLATAAATVAWHRVGILERVVGARRATVRALADLLAGRR